MFDWMLLNVRLMFCGFFFILVFFSTHLYCLVGCLSMTVWTHAVFGCLIYVLYLHLFSAVEHVSHGKAL